MEEKKASMNPGSLPGPGALNSEAKSNKEVLPPEDRMKLVKKEAALKFSKGEEMMLAAKKMMAEADAKEVLANENLKVSKEFLAEAKAALKKAMELKKEN